MWWRNCIHYTCQTQHEGKTFSGTSGGPASSTTVRQPRVAQRPGGAIEGGSAAAGGRSSSVKGMSRWDKNIHALSTYVSEHGTALVPTSYKCSVNGETVSLGSWVTYVRIKYRAGTLSPERIAQLESFAGWAWGPCKPGPSGNPDRDKAMVQARQAGRSLQSIGDEYGLSRQRVHQILNRMGYKETASA